MQKYTVEMTCDGKLATVYHMRLLYNSNKQTTQGYIV